MPKGGKPRGRPRGSRNKPKVMKKVSNARQAYKKPIRDQMMLRRAGVVETKVRVDSDIQANNGHLEENDWEQPLAWKPLGYSELGIGPANLGANAFTWIPLRSFTRISRGLGDDQMIGNNLTSKYLTVKAQFRFPNNRYIQRSSNMDVTKPAERNLNVFIENQCKLYFICGWCTKNMGRPIQISKAGDGLLAKQVDEAALARYVCDQIEPYFNDDTDKLEFRPRQTTNIKVLHYSRVRPDLTGTIATQGKSTENWHPTAGGGAVQAIDAHGSIPDVYKSFTFKTGRKIQMTLGTPATANASPADTQNFYPNDNWLPFCIAYNPDYEELLAQHGATSDPNEYFAKVCQIQFRSNSAHYFSDS